ncbi:MAG TPA: DegQ family serine endoprotease [Verrucomicrobiae bacterium]|nr:DegQ family serine endoprotease [Verrucomicrobiae bacterium]
MKPRRLQALGILFGTGLFVATGLMIFTGADRPPASREKTRAPIADGNTAALRALGESFGEIADRVGPSVVTVYSEKVIKFHQPDFSFPFGDQFPFHWFFGDQDSPHPRFQPRQREYKFSQSGLGSGIIVDKEGHILTNNHVVNDVNEIKVILADKREFPAEIVGTDPKTDLAVIKIKGEAPRDLPTAVLGDSDAVHVGDWVLAIGAPFGYAQTVTHGIISAKGRTDVDEDSNDYEDFLQTDAPINPGNSGGPLVNLNGEVIGINTAIATSVGQFAGVGFAIPINMARDVMNELIQTGKVRRGFLGIGIQNIDEDLAHKFDLPDTNGALVSQVNKDSPAERAGIKVGDVIVRYNGKKIEDTQRLRNLVAATAPDHKADVTVFRNGQERTLVVTVGELASAKGEGGEETEEANSAASDLGLTVAPLTTANAKQYNLDANDKGVVVTDVEDDSPAADGDLRTGDLITEVNRQPVANPDEFQDALARAKAKDSVLILAKRDGVSRFVILRWTKK